jgi:hypothetical protein
MIKSLLAIAVTVIGCASSLVLPSNSRDIIVHNDSSAIDAIITLCRNHGENSEQDYELILDLLPQVQQTERVRLSSRANRSKKFLDMTICFAFGAAVGVSLIAMGLGTFYCYACNQEQKTTANKVLIPDSFTQQKNWCWMVSTLQCLYRLKPFREWLDQKSAEDCAQMSLHEQDQVVLARLLKDLFEKMERYAISHNDVNGKERVLATENFYDQLFKIQEHSQTPLSGLTPEKGYGKVSDSTQFCAALQEFLFDKNKKTLVFGADLLVDQRRLTRQQFLLTALNSPQEEVNTLTLAEPRPVICFRESQDTGFGRKIDASINIADKKYGLTAMAMSHPGHWNASVEYNNGSWYLFDSIGQVRKKLEVDDMKKIYDGKGYKGYEPRLIFYTQDNGGI